MTQHTILLLAANPEEMRRLNLDDEARAIRIALQQKGHGDTFKLEVWPAARPLDLLEGLGMLAPTVVHFSGHGGSRAPGQPAVARRDANGPASADDHATASIDAERHGLFFQGPDALPQFVSAAALTEAFAAAGASVKLVVLNACYSELLANALLPYVGCVVGVAGAIGDASAGQFSVGFYGGLAQRRSIEAAFAQGRAAVRLEDLPDHDQPQLRVRANVDAKAMVVASMPPPTGKVPPSPPPRKAISFALERQRHAGVVARDRLLAQIDQLVVTDSVDRWVVVTGGPGMGKSAVLAAWLARREAAGDTVPHHFIRRGWANWDDPEALVNSLLVQIESRFPDAQPSEADSQLAPAARLAASLSRVSERALVPRGERLVLLIDGLDEYDAPPGPPPADPLTAFLPYALPPGVGVLCATRPRHPHVDMLAMRGMLVQIDLDDSNAFADDNAATARAFWEREAPKLGLDEHFVAHAVERASGNLQHAVMLCQHLAGLPPAQRRVEEVPVGLSGLLARTWARARTDPATVAGLGVLCAAREALTLDELERVAGWSGEAQRDAFLRSGREMLLETRRTNAVREYRLHHDSIRTYVAEAIGAATIVRHHRALAERLATWPAPPDPAARRYALRHALLHRTEACAWDDAWRVASDTQFLEAKCREFGVHDVENDMERVAARCRAVGDRAHSERFADLARAIGRESHWLRTTPEAFAVLIWNRLRRYGWTADDLNAQLGVLAAADMLRVHHTATRESATLVRNFRGHAFWVTGCAVTPDGRHAISASYDRTLKLWELASGRELATLTGHTDYVTSCAVTPDGKYVISTSADQTLKVWELASRRALYTLKGHTSWVTTCAVTPDGRQVVSASNDATLKVWELASGRELATFRGHASPITACAVMPDGRRGLSGAEDQTLKVWELSSGRELGTLAGHASWITACAVTPNGQHAISGAADNTLKVWELSSGRELATFTGHASMVTACAVTPDGRHVVSASYDQTLKVWELSSGRELATLEGHTNLVSRCAVAPDGRHVISASYDQTLKVWQLGSGRERALLDGHTTLVRACAVTPDGRHAVSGSADQTLKVWELAGAREVATLRGHSSWVSGCAVTPDGQRIVSASDDRTLKVWDLSSGRESATLRGHASWVSGCAVTPDGLHVVSASNDQTLKVWELASGRELATLAGHTARVTSCVMTPDGRYIVSTSEDRTLKIWDLASGRALRTLEGHTAKARACSLTPDGKHIVSASDDQTLKVWELGTGRVVATLAGHTTRVTACKVTPDGRYLVSASDDHTLKVWDLATYTCRLTHRGDAAYLAVAVTATLVVAGDTSGAVWFLAMPPSMVLPLH